VVKSQSDVINAKKLLRAAEGQIAEARVELNTLMGRDPSATLQVSGTLEGARSELYKDRLCSRWPWRATRVFARDQCKG